MPNVCSWATRKNIWVIFLAETSKDLEIILITTVLSFTNSLSRTSLYFSLKTSFVYSNLFSLAKRRHAQLLKITIHQLFHYCSLRQCYRVPFRFVIYRSFSSDFDGFSHLPKHSVTVVHPSHIHSHCNSFSQTEEV